MTPLSLHAARPLLHIPAGFQWLERRRLAGMARPGLLASVEDDLASLKALGCDLLISVEERAPIQEADAERHDLTFLHVPAEERHAPTVAAAWYACAEIEQALLHGKRVVVCGRDGLGRTGTLLAAVLVFLGEDVLHALRVVRRVEPRWVQTDAQLAFLFDLHRVVLHREREAERRALPGERQERALGGRKMH
jgi:atypical dual specificity phosphatase